MNEPALSARDAFFSDLNNEVCSDADYAPAIDEWQSFKSATQQLNLEISLQTDVLLLANIVEEFRGV